MSIRIMTLDDGSDRLIEGIHTLRRQVYAGDSHYCPPFEGALQRELVRSKYSQHQRIFGDWEGDSLQAVAVARLSEDLSLDDQSVATIGHFEALNDPERVTDLLARAADWCHEQGADVVIGPMNGDTWHSYRFSIGPREERPFYLEPYNPDYYPQLWEAAGFEVLATYHSRRIDDLKGAAREFAPRWHSVREEGYRFEPIIAEDLDRALDRIYDLVCVGFAANFLYTPISREDFKAKYDGVELLLEKDLSFFVLDEDGSEAGFAFVFPDYAPAIAAMKGKKHLLAKLKFLMKRRRVHANIKTFAILPEHRGRGLASAMAHRYYKAIADAGYEAANICLIHDDNVGSAKMDGQRGRVLRNYALYAYQG